MTQIQLHPTRQAMGQIKLPGSKSISNRVLLLAALSHGTTHIHNLLEADDTTHMLGALETLGVVVQKNGFSVALQGVAGIFPTQSATLFLGNAGTAFRTLTAALALMQGEYELSGVSRMHERPIGDLVDALRIAGANIIYRHQDSYPPLAIHPAQPYTGGTIPINGTVSSQFLTALLIALPLTGQTTTLIVTGELISKPYVEITLNLMARFGVTVKRTNWAQFVIPGSQHYQSPGEVYVEGDASSASYFLAAGALAGGPVRVQGIGRNSIQGDVQFATILRQMGADVTIGKYWIETRSTGVLKAVDLDLNFMPDAAMTLAVTALAAQGTTTLRNIASWRVKETDRLSAMAAELRKIGAIVEEGPDYIRITPPAKLIPNAIIDTYHDHRIAMCFSLVALLGNPIIINDPQCVSKTFPRYFETLVALQSFTVNTRPSTRI